MPPPPSSSSHRCAQAARRQAPVMHTTRMPFVKSCAVVMTVRSFAKQSISFVMLIHEHHRPVAHRPWSWQAHTAEYLDFVRTLSDEVPTHQPTNQPLAIFWLSCDREDNRAVLWVRWLSRRRRCPSRPTYRCAASPSTLPVLSSASFRHRRSSRNVVGKVGAERLTHAIVFACAALDLAVREGAAEGGGDVGHALHAGIPRRRHPRRALPTLASACLSVGLWLCCWLSVFTD